MQEAGIEPCGVVQKGRRSYRGRTALHWAARNGHTHVVQYLVDDCGMDVDARTSDAGILNQPFPLSVYSP